MSIRGLTNPISNEEQNITVRNITYTGTLNPTPGQLFVTVSLPGKGGTYTGTTEVPINQAIAFVASQSGGTVFVKSGTYVISNPIQLLDTVNLNGETTNSVILQADNTTPPTRLMEATMTNTKMTNLTFNGYATVAHIRLYGSGAVLQNLNIGGSDGVLYTPTGLSLEDLGGVGQFVSVLNTQIGDFATQMVYISANNWNPLFSQCIFNNNAINAIGIKNDGFSLQASNNYFLFCSVAIQTGLTVLSINNVFAGCVKCHRIDAVASPIPIVSLLVSGANAINFGTSVSFVEMDVPAGLTFIVSIGSFALVGAPPSGPSLQFSGQGDKTYYVNSTTIVTASDDGLGTITQDSFITQPSFPQLVAPSPVYGMTYLDGDPVGAGPLQQKRWNGSAWIDF